MPLDPITIGYTALQVADWASGGQVSKTVLSWFGVVGTDEMTKRKNNLAREVQAHALMGYYDYTHNIKNMGEHYKLIIQKLINKKSETIGTVESHIRAAVEYKSQLASLQAAQGVIVGEIGPKVLTFLWQKTETDASEPAQRVRKLILDITSGVYQLPSAIIPVLAVGETVTADEVPALIDKMTAIAVSAERGLWQTMALSPVGDGSLIDTLVPKYYAVLRAYTDGITGFLTGMQGYLQTSGTELKNIIRGLDIPADLPEVSFRVSQPGGVSIGSAPGDLSAIIPVIVGGALIFLVSGS